MLAESPSTTAILTASISTSSVLSKCFCPRTCEKDVHRGRDPRVAHLALHILWVRPASTIQVACEARKQRQLIQDGPSFRAPGLMCRGSVLLSRMGGHVLTD
jgi:hypothetical protein